MPKFHWTKCEDEVILNQINKTGLTNDTYHALAGRMSRRSYDSIRRRCREVSLGNVKYKDEDELGWPEPEPDGDRKHVEAVIKLRRQIALRQKRNAKH